MRQIYYCIIIINYCCHFIIIYICYVSLHYATHCGAFSISFSLFYSTMHVFFIENLRLAALCCSGYKIHKIKLSYMTLYVQDIERYIFFPNDSAKRNKIFKPAVSSNMWNNSARVSLKRYRRHIPSIISSIFAERFFVEKTQ